MFKLPKAMAVVLVIGAMVVAGGAAAAGAQPATAAPPAQAANITNAPHLDMAKYAELFLKSFEGQLGLDDAQINTAFSGSVSDTLDQVVKDGVITAEQAAQAKTFVKDGVTGLIAKLATFVPKFGLDQNNLKRARPAGEALEPASLAAALGLSSSDLEAELKSGKSITEIASEHQIDLAAVKNTILTNAKSQLESAVSGGQLTQSQADEEYQALSQKIDGLGSRSAPPDKPAQKIPGDKKLSEFEPSKYANLCLTAFESRLNLDDAKLDAAFSAAVSETTAQAVTDGVITAEQATQAKTFAQMGVRQLAAMAGKMPSALFGERGGPSSNGLQPAAIAAALGLSSSELKTELQSGKPIADIAAEHELDLTHVKQAILAQFKAQLETAVKNGKMTQMLADQMYAKVSSGIELLVTKPMLDLK